MNEDIFRQYDIRGIAATDLDDDTVEKIGRAFGTTVVRTLQPESPSVGVGFDMRTSSERLFAALSKGLRAAGVDVVSLGMVPTPLVYFATFTRPIDACIQITGSHNPSEYNGFKMMIGKDTLHGETIQDLRKLIEAGDFETGEGEERSIGDLKETYTAWVSENLDLGPNPISIAVDCGNGVTGVMAEDFVRDTLGCETLGLFTEPDGTFPNHHPDPTVPENLESLVEAVRENDCDLGVAYDGDGDRIGVVDETGEIIFGDKLMILLSRAVLEEFPGATIIGEVKCSQTLFDDIEAHGGNAIMARVGHSLIKAKIKETGAKLAGEMSGHIFFNDRFFGFDDALYATARLVEILSHTDQTLSELLADVPTTYATPEIRQPCDEKLKFEIPGVVAQMFADDYDVNTIDGARINFGDGWALCRASNTQPVLVLRVEAKSKSRRDELLAIIEDAVVRAEDQLKPGR